MKLTERIAAMLKRELKEAGMTQAEVAKRIGKSRVHVCYVLSGKKNLTLETIEEIAGAIGIRLAIVKDLHKCQ